jgi:hypothetical protein
MGGGVVIHYGGDYSEFWVGIGSGTESGPVRSQHQRARVGLTIEHRLR